MIIAHGKGIIWLDLDYSISTSVANYLLAELRLVIVYILVKSGYIYLQNRILIENITNNNKY